MKTKYSVLRNLLVSGLFLLSASGLFAQANFAGSWALNDSKSNFGDSQFRFAASTMVVTQNATTLSVESNMTGPDGGEMKTNASYKLDGSVSENTAFGNTMRKTTAAWSADKATLTLSHTMTFDMNGESREIKSSDEWKLSDGGKVLIITSTRTGRDGEAMKTTAAYDKK
jgi:hypothetical protein